MREFDHLKAQKFKKMLSDWPYESKLEPMKEHLKSFHLEDLYGIHRALVKYFKDPSLTTAFTKYAKTLVDKERFKLKDEKMEASAYLDLLFEWIKGKTRPLQFEFTSTQLLFARRFVGEGGSVVPVSSVALVNKILTYTREWVQLYTVVEAKNAEFKSVILKAHLYAFSFPSDYWKAIGTKVTTGFQAGKEADPSSTMEQWQLGFTAFANEYYEKAIELLYGSGVLSKTLNGVMN